MYVYCAQFLLLVRDTDWQIERAPFFAGTPGSRRGGEKAGALIVYPGL